jgi:hypothetical protein
MVTDVQKVSLLERVEPLNCEPGARGSDGEKTTRAKSRGTETTNYTNKTKNSITKDSFGDLF